MRARGFTLIELLVVIGIMAILFTITSINLVAPQRRTSMGETVSLLTSDLRNQQTKSMLGDASGSSSENFGIFFDSDNYVLFKGDSYDPSDPANFEIELTPGFEFTGTGFPSSVIIFSRGSGEAANFINDTYQLNLTDTQNGETTVITVNRYGTVTQIN